MLSSVPHLCSLLYATYLHSHTSVHCCMVPYCVLYVILGPHIMLSSSFFRCRTPRNRRTRANQIMGTGCQRTKVCFRIHTLVPTNMLPPRHPPYACKPQSRTLRCVLFSCGTYPIDLDRHCHPVLTPASGSLPLPTIVDAGFLTLFVVLAGRLVYEEGIRKLG